MNKKDIWYPCIAAVLGVILVVPLVLYYGFGIDLPLPSLRP